MTELNDWLKVSAPAQRRLYEYVNWERLAEAKEPAASVVRIQVCRATRLRKKTQNIMPQWKGRRSVIFFFFSKHDSNSFRTGRSRANKAGWKWKRAADLENRDGEECFFEVKTGSDTAALTVNWGSSAIKTRWRVLAAAGCRECAVILMRPKTAGSVIIYRTPSGLFSSFYNTLYDGVVEYVVFFFVFFLMPRHFILDLTRHRRPIPATWAQHIPTLLCTLCVFANRTE